MRMIDRRRCRSLGFAKGKFDNVSLKGSIAYAPSESSNVYFSVSEGFEAVVLIILVT